MQQSAPTVLSVINFNENKPLPHTRRRSYIFFEPKSKELGFANTNTSTQFQHSNIRANAIRREPFETREPIPMTSPPVNSTARSEAFARIRIPHDHDVLCGRGGGINSHPGNKMFRDLVRERKESYNLAHSKAAKAKVSREIMDQVANLSPPGRFLQREETEKGALTGKNSTYWIEIDYVKAMAKTSQALREGAPAIRARAKTNNEEEGLHGKANTKRNALPQANTGQNSRPNLPPRKDSKNNNPSSFVSSPKSLKRKIDSADSPRYRKLNIQDDTSLCAEYDMKIQDANNLNNLGTNLSINRISPQCNNTNMEIEMTEEEKMEKMELSSSIPLLTSIPGIVPEASQTNNEISDDSQKDSEENCNLDNTPNLLPIPPTSDTPMTSFLLPSSCVSSKPLISVFSKSLMRSHSLALSDLSEPPTNELFLHQDSLLLDNCDQTFQDPFINDKEDCWDQLLEGHPDFSATTIHSGNKHCRSYLRAISQSSARSLSSNSLFLPNVDNSNKTKSTEKKNVCFCFCDGHDEASKELCPCNSLANSILKGELGL